MSSWCTIESDPGVFHALLQAWGVKGLTVEELWSLEPEAFAPLKPVHGLFFLFKWQKWEAPVAAAAGGGGDAPTAADDVVFIQQVVPNACCSIALLHVLLNSGHADVAPGPVLSDFRDFTAGFDAATRGLALGECEPIRASHNSFARPEPFVHEERRARDDDDEVYHFIAYVPVGGAVYELDGLAPAPVRLGDVPPPSAGGGDDTDAWVAAATPAIQARIAQYAASEIRFNLLALCRDRLPGLRAAAVGIASQLRAVHAAIVAAGGGGAGDGSTADPLPVPEAAVASTGLALEDVGFGDSTDGGASSSSSSSAAASTAVDGDASALVARYRDLQGDLAAVAAQLLECVERAGGR
jgi:ubiquitin carboxyl-terminal hydrolase L5